MNHQEKKLWKKLKAITRVKMMFRFGAASKSNAESDDSNQTSPETSPAINSSAVTTPASPIAKKVKNKIKIDSVNLANMGGSSSSSTSDSFYESGEDDEAESGITSGKENGLHHQVQITHHKCVLSFRWYESRATNAFLRWYKSRTINASCLFAGTNHAP